MRTLYLIDASIFVFRSYYAYPPHLLDRRGEPANALFGYGMFLCELLERRGPSHIAAGFDESLGSSFRRELLPAYKANRPTAPPDLARQFRACRALTSALGVVQVASPRYEADDLIGALAANARRDGFRMVYVSADKDLCQLVEAGDRFWDPGRSRWLDAAGVQQALGVRPGQVPDLLGLAGDAVDNIPGVPGIGRKIGAALVSALDDLEGVYGALERVATVVSRGGARIRRLLEGHREQAWLSRRLATIDRGAPAPAAELAWAGVDRHALAALALPPALERRALHLVGSHTEVDTAAWTGTQ